MNKKKISRVGIVCLFLFSTMTLWSQIVSEEFGSRKLNDKRKIVTYLPENHSNKEAYPLLVVLDAGTLMEPVMASVRLYEYYGDMPESIIVGIYNTSDDVTTEKNGALSRSNADFLDFLGMELLPYIQGKYMIDNFKGIVATNESAYLLNYLFFASKPIFNAIIGLNPKSLPYMQSVIVEKLEAVKSPVSYYVASTDMQSESVYKNTKELDTSIRSNTNDLVKFYHEEFPKSSPQSVTLSGIARSFDLLFDSYKPISALEYKTKVQPLTENVFDYLSEKYSRIETELGLKKKPILNDIMAIYDVIQLQEDWDSLLKLSDFVKGNGYEKTAMPNYFLGEYYDKTGDVKKALRAYQRAYTESPIDFIKKDLIESKMSQLKGK